MYDEKLSLNLIVILGIGSGSKVDPGGGGIGNGSIEKNLGVLGWQTYDQSDSFARREK